MTTFACTLTEYDPDKPWIVVSTARDSVKLDDGTSFHTWAQERWPSPRFRATLDLQPFRWASDLRS